MNVSIDTDISDRRNKWLGRENSKLVLRGQRNLEYLIMQKESDCTCNLLDAIRVTRGKARVMHFVFIQQTGGLKRGAVGIWTQVIIWKVCSLKTSGHNPQSDMTKSYDLKQNSHNNINVVEVSVGVLWLNYFCGCTWSLQGHKRNLGLLLFSQEYISSCSRCDRQCRAERTDLLTCFHTIPSI